MHLLNPFRFAGGAPPPFVVDGVTFPNTDSGLRRGAQLTGAADSKLFSFAVWCRVITFVSFSPITMSVAPGAAAGTAGTHTFISTQTGANRFAVKARGTTTSLVLDLRTDTVTTNTWYCLMGSFDMSSTAKRHLYLGDTNTIAVYTYINEAIDFTVNDFSVAIAPDLSQETDIELGPLWYAPGQYIDFANSANRRKFFSSTGDPVDAGSDGSLPTGVAPLVYLRCLDGAAASTYATNLGTGGNLTISGGPLGIASTSPSD